MSGDSETLRSSATFRQLALSNSFLIEALVQLLVEKRFVNHEEIADLVEELEKKAGAGIRMR